MKRCVHFTLAMAYLSHFFCAVLADERPLVMTESGFASSFYPEYLKGRSFNVDTDGVSVVTTGKLKRDVSMLTNLPVVRLYAQARGLETLEGIQVLKNLQVLDISGNNIQDLSPLKSLPLISLNIAGNPIRDLSPVLKPSLKELYLSGTEVKDLACLTNTSLERLELGTGPVMRSFDALTKIPLKRLSFLQCQQMQVKDIASLQLESLRVFFLRQTDLHDLTKMPLKELDLQEAEIDSLAPLAPMAIHSLTVASSSLRILHGIEKLPLGKLKLFTPHVWDVWPIRNMALKELYMFCDDGDLTSITNIPLRTLCIDKELAIRNIHLLEKMKTLEFIGVERNGAGCSAQEFFAKYRRAKKGATAGDRDR